MASASGDRDSPFSQGARLPRLSQQVPMSQQAPSAFSSEDAAERDLMADFSAQVERYRRLSSGERAALLEAAGAGDARAGRRLVEHHLYLVFEAAARYRGQGLGFADLFQAGSEGLIQEVDRYRGREVDFIASSERAVARAIEGAIAQDTGTRRNETALVEACRALEKATLLLQGRLCREPSVAELAELLEWDGGRVEAIRTMLAEARTRQDLELLAYLDAAEGSADDAGGDPA